MLQPEGMKLKIEAIAQVDYIVTMSKINENLPNKIYKLSSCGVAPGMSVVFNALFSTRRRSCEGRILTLNQVW